MGAAVLLLQGLSLLCLLGLLAQPAAAAPYTPQRDDDIVERLPQRLGSSAERSQARALRARLQQGPENLPLALQLARESMERARLQGDPRELGQAQALLAPWWGQERPPPALRLLRATIRQSQHDFLPALADFDALLASPGLAPPLQAQAELSRAALLQVLGRWSEARAGCERLSRLPTAALHGRICLAELDSLQGRAAEAQAALARLAGEAAAPQAWLQLLRAELAERQASDAAEPLYKAALQAAPEIYTRAAYADWLLDRQRAPEAAALLLAHGSERQAEGQDLPDALLLRLAIAWKQTQDPRAAAAAADLRARFEAAEQRGDRSHGRERARFALDVAPDATQALAQARLNWAQQKEPADALLLLRAARAAQQPAAAEAVRQFVRATGFQDQRQRGLL